MTKQASALMVVIGAMVLGYCELDYTGTAPLSPLAAGMVVAGGVGIYLLSAATHKLASDEKKLSSQSRL